MEKYVEEASFVANDDNDLREAYDHELSARMAEREVGFDEGYDEGQTKMKEQLIKTMFKNNLSARDISIATELNLDEVENVISKIKSDD